MAELADAPDLGSGSSECRFDSCYPHGEKARARKYAAFRLFSFFPGTKMILFFIVNREQKFQKKI